MRNNNLNTKKKLESVQSALLPIIEELDGSYTECPHCTRKSFTNREESLLRVTLRKLVEQIDRTVAKLQ